VTSWARAAIWIAVYLGLVSFPLLALLAAPRPDGLGFGWDLALALGFAGLAVMGLQFGLTARFRRASAPFGIDILYYFHRAMALVGLGLLTVHWGVFRVTAPGALSPALPWEAPAYMTAGRLALLLFAGIVASSLLRKALGLEYDRWRVLHAALAVAAVGLSLWHVAGAGYYTGALWRRGLLISYAAGWAALVLFVRVVRPAWLLRRPYRVVDVRPERGHSWTLALEPEGHPGIRFSPGQFVWLSLRASPFRAREHPFSISSSAAVEGRVEVTIRELGDFTRTVGETRVGEVAYVDGPYGAFTADRHPDAGGFAFVAGGVGIAPIASMLRTLADRGEHRPLSLVYANDRWEDALLREELEGLTARLDLRVVHVIREPPPGWAGESGLVTAEVLARAFPDPAERWVYFVCGPEPMTEAVQRSLRAMGVPMRRIHFELFDMA
jgi:predicted ferric reductase